MNNIEFLQIGGSTPLEELIMYLNSLSIPLRHQAIIYITPFVKTVCCPPKFLVTTVEQNINFETNNLHHHDFFQGLFYYLAFMLNIAPNMSNFLSRQTILVDVENVSRNTLIQLLCLTQAQDVAQINTLIECIATKKRGDLPVEHIKTILNNLQLENANIIYIQPIFGTKDGVTGENLFGSLKYESTEKCHIYNIFLPRVHETELKNSVPPGFVYNDMLRFNKSDTKDTRYIGHLDENYIYEPVGDSLQIGTYLWPEPDKNSRGIRTPMHPIHSFQADDVCLCMIYTYLTTSAPRQSVILFTMDNYSWYTNINKVNARWLNLNYSLNDSRFSIYTSTECMPIKNCVTINDKLINRDIIQYLNAQLTRFTLTPEQIHEINNIVLYYCGANKHPERTLHRNIYHTTGQFITLENPEILHIPLSPPPKQLPPQPQPQPPAPEIDIDIARIRAEYIRMYNTSNDKDAMTHYSGGTRFNDFVDYIRQNALRQRVEIWALLLNRVQKAKLLHLQQFKESVNLLDTPTQSSYLDKTHFNLKFKEYMDRCTESHIFWGKTRSLLEEMIFLNNIQSHFAEYYNTKPPPMPQVTISEYLHNILIFFSSDILSKSMIMLTQDITCWPYLVNEINTQGTLDTWKQEYRNLYTRPTPPGAPAPPDVNDISFFEFMCKNIIPVWFHQVKTQSPQNILQIMQLQKQLYKRQFRQIEPQEMLVTDEVIKYNKYMTFIVYRWKKEKMTSPNLTLLHVMAQFETETKLKQQQRKRPSDPQVEGPSKNPKKFYSKYLKYKTKYLNLKNK